MAFSPDGRSLASGSDDHTVKIWDRNSPRTSLNLSMLPGNEWISWRPSSLFYSASLQGDEFAAVRFNRELTSLYPLEYYRDQLRHPDLVADSRLLPEIEVRSVRFPWDPFTVVAPKPIRKWWDTSENKALWAGGSLTVAAFVFIVIRLARRRTDPMEVARAFFQQAGFDGVETRQTRLRLTADSRASLASLWDSEAEHPETDVRPWRGSSDEYEKLYLVYRKQGPASEQIQGLRRELNCEVIPLASQILEAAIRAGEAQTKLRELEGPYVTRTDPYMESRPIEDPTWFFGRAEQIGRLPDVISQGQHVGVFGLRKVGKTSLINQVHRRFIDVPTVFIDCQAFTAKAHIYFGEVLRQIHASLATFGVDVPELPSHIDTESFRASMIAYWESWQSRGHRERFVIVLDEVDKLFPDRRIEGSDEGLIEYVKLFRVVRGLAQANGCLALVVVAYRPDVNRYDALTERSGENPMFRSYQEEYLGYLTLEESKSLVIDIGIWKDIRWDDRAAERVYDHCGGHPLITRFFASAACEEGRCKNIDYERVEAAAAETVRTLRRNDIGNYYGEGCWTLLREDEREVLRRVARPGMPVLPKAPSRNRRMSL